MDSSNVTKSCTKAKTIAELLPVLNGTIPGIVISSDVTAKKQPRTTIAPIRTAEKAIRPMTIAEINIQALSVQQPKNSQVDMSAMKKKWNSSVKVEKKFVNRTRATEDPKHKSVRKVLNFPAKTKVPNITVQSETPKFPRPEHRPKKSFCVPAKSKIRISGVCGITETPAMSNKPAKNRMTLANKENHSKVVTTNKVVTPRRPAQSKHFLTPSIPNTTMCSEYSCSDSSFLMKEKEINDLEEKVNAVTNEPTLEHIENISPLVSTPFKCYRSVQGYFSNSINFDNTAEIHDNTIMSFDKTSSNKDKKIKEDSVIFSLCSMLNKASVSNTEMMNVSFENLLDLEKCAKDNVTRIDNSIKEMIKIRETEVKELEAIRELIHKKKTKIGVENVRKTIIVTNENARNANGAYVNGKCNGKLDVTEDAMKIKVTPKKIILTAEPCFENDNGRNLDNVLINGDCNGIPEDLTEDTMNIKLTPKKIIITGEPCSVIKSCLKSPYSITARKLCLRKRVFFKSMPNIYGTQKLDSDLNETALNMYMEMKGHMPFLNSPGFKPRQIEMPDTPAVTSHNLQLQLDKLYSES